MNDSTHIEYCATILETNPACVMSVLNNRKSESDDSSRYILPSCTILCRAWANNGAMSRYLGPACHALSAILRGSPANDGGLAIIMSNFSSLSLIHISEPTRLGMISYA